MRIPPFLRNSLLAASLLPASLCLRERSVSAQPYPPQSSTATDLRMEDYEQRAGPFAVGGQNYAVILRGKRIVNAGGPGPAQTLVDVKITDAGGNAVYEKAFSNATQQGQFSRSFSASAELMSGKTGAGLVIRYLEQSQISRTGVLQSQETWQLFGMVNGKLAPLGTPAPIGSAGSGGPFMGVMMRASNGTVTVISQPDTIEIRAWTGYFSVFIPLRVNWNNGGLAQGQRCMEMWGGGLREVGCDMRVEAERKPPADEFTFARLFSEASENMGTPDHIVLQKDSKVEILGSRAIAMWTENAERIQPNLSDLWLHVRIDTREGWIHGDEDFAAVGLPTGSPAP
jgi:hypothetical protein